MRPSTSMLHGTEVPNIIKLRGKSKRNSITILLDLGSIHNFLAIETAKKIGCKITKSAPMRIIVANDNYLMSRHTCHKFKWMIHRMEFEDSVRLVRLGGNDMILEGDWMKGHNLVLLDFVEYKVHVTHNGKRVKLKGIYSEVELRRMSTTRVKHLLKKGQAIWAHLFTLTAEEVEEHEQVHAVIQRVLK